MKLTVKLISLIILLLLVSPLILLKGCGNSGSGSGACSDGVAPSGSTIIGPSGLSAPSASAGSCYSGIGFTVKGPDGNPMNGVCVVVTTNGSIALTTANDFNCSNALTSPKTQIVTRTDDSGNVILDFVTPTTTVGTTFFVEVASGALSVVATTPAAQ